MGPGEPEILEPASADDELPRFVPLRRVSGRRRMLLFIVGPLLWLGAVVAVAYVANRSYAIPVALIVLGGALLVALVALVPMRVRRVREERRR